MTSAPAPDTQAGGPRANGWRDYWDHFDRLEGIYRAQAGDYVSALVRAVPVCHNDRVLDVGCAYGFVAELLAQRVREVALWDPSPSMQQHAGRLIASVDNARLLPALKPARSEYDIILMNSVLQYLDVTERVDLLAACEAQLAPSGSLVLSDLIFERSALRDAVDVMLFASRKGLLLHLIRDSVADLRMHTLHRRSPLAVIPPSVLRAEARSLGLTLNVLPENLTHFRGRYAAVLTRA